MTPQNAASHLGLICFFKLFSLKYEIKIEKLLLMALKKKVEHPNDKYGKVNSSQVGLFQLCHEIIDLLMIDIASGSILKSKGLLSAIPREVSLISMTFSSATCYSLSRRKDEVHI